MEYTRERLGEVLVRSGLIARERLDEMLEIQRRTGGKLGAVLVRELVVTEDQIAAALAEQKQLDHINLTTYLVDRSAASLLPERFARMRTVLPISYDNGDIVLAMADPLDIETIDDVEVRTGLKVHPVVASATQILYAIDKYIASADAFEKLVDVDDADETLELEEVVTGDDVPVVRIVNQVLREAVREGASDVHVEPTKDGLRVRYRIDGVLQDVSTLPRQARPGVISRLKIMADLDIAERRRPQDGRIALKVDDRSVDLRVALLPASEGESIVVRVLDSELTLLSLEDVGMVESDRERVRQMLGRPYGAVLASGPTGSGKSTTLYAAMQILNSPDRKIITIEDPVEYRMAGITQIAVNARIGLTFAAGLRTSLRADPDVVMVGEIRDPETAEIAIRSALTGHLMLSSIHTNDAPSALTRLVDMGVPPYIASSALAGIVAQRLARRLCKSCRAPVKKTKAALKAAGFSEARLREGVDVFGPVGCPECHNTGYRGRVGLFEVMTIDECLTRAFLNQVPSEELRAIALDSGMRPLREDALEKVAAGITSLEEVDRVVI